MADSGGATESSLLSKLEPSADLSSIHHLFSSYLQPFSPIIQNPKKRSKSTKIDAETTTTIRSLAKQFLSFITRSLTLIPKRLNETPKLDPEHALELFETYALCISCLEAVSSQLSCKPYHVQIQRVRLIHCYEYWGRYNDAQNEGLSVLEFIGNMSGKRNGKIVERVVPELGKENGDKDVALLVFEVVVSLVKCAANARSKKEEDYRRVLTMVDEIEPWLRVIDADSYEKLHKSLVSYLNRCTLFVVGEYALFDRNLARRFCDVIFKEYRRSPVNDQTSKFGRRICSLIFSELDNQLLSNVGILTCVLDNMAKECKIGKETAIVNFLELAEYCAQKCRFATVNICGAVATHFVKLAADLSQVNLLVDKIMRLYAITLSMSDLRYYSRGCNSKTPKAVNDKYISKVLLDLEDELQSFTTVHGSVTILPTDMESYMSLCFNALKFLCEPLSELINSERKNLLCEIEDIPIKLPNIEDTFHQFRRCFLSASEKEIDVYEDNSRTILAIATAAFTLSFTTKQRAKESVSFLKHLIKVDRGQANGLKYLYASLHNVGIVLYRDNRIKEATESFKLCCQAAWKCIRQFCEASASSKDKSSCDLTEDSIAAFVTEACSKSTFLLDILYQCGSKNISNTVTDCLQSWSVAHNLFDKIPVPAALVKQWVKIQCKETKDPEAARMVPTINVLMSKDSEMLKETLGILLEQELQAYTEMKSLNPDLSKLMQTTITKTLFEEICTTNVNCLQKSRILIANARESRACGVEGLNDCRQNLSDAISLLSDLCSKDKEDSGPVCQLLAEAYCLHALSTQEVEPKSEFLSEDIGNALRLWLSKKHSQSVEQIDTESQNTITLLYHVVDFLSLKGYVEDHSDIYEILIRYITQKKSVPLEECLAMLWQSRSLNHALCTSPVNDTFFTILSNHCNLSISKEFWRSCMERSKALDVGFSQCFSVISTLSTPDSCNSELATTIDEVKKAASDLINTVPLSSKSLFLAAYLYYDLSEGLIARGLMIEALMYAKESHRLRIKLLKKHFAYSIEQHDDIMDTNGEVIKKRGYQLTSFHMHSLVATTAWSHDKSSSEFEDFILTPWNILRCYLESILQVGSIQEMVGNGHEAEALLLWGKNISCVQHLPIFLVSFSASLGKLYRKQRLWHLAEKELESAKDVLADSGTDISCSKCKLILEVKVYQQLGDLSRSRFSNSPGNKLQEDLSEAEKYYQTAVDKLKLSEWNNCISNFKESSSRNTMFCDSFMFGASDGSNISSCANQAEQKAIQPKVPRKGRKTVKSLPPQEKRVTSRVTRSKQKNGCAQNEKQNVCDVALITKGTQKSKGFSTGACGCKIACVCDDVDCWHCLPTGIMKSKSLRSIIQMKWECTRRRFLIRLLTGIGKCLMGRNETHRALEVFMEGISMMVNRSTFGASCSLLSVTFLAELIERNVTGDVFAVEQASILYNICWLSLKSSSDKATRDQCCDMSPIPIPLVVSGLKLSFILGREFPELFQKVSRLLALLYTLAPLNNFFSMLSSSSNTLSESQMASYFHQASLGTHLTYRLFSHLGRKKDDSTMDVDELCLPSSSFLSLHRLAPQSVLELEEFILKFFEKLPCVTIVCVSFLGDSYVSLLRELLSYNISTRACVMFSRMNSDSAPVVVVLPVDPILSGSSNDDEGSSSSMLHDKRSCDKLWCCPWGQSIIDEVVPLFRTILEENYLSSSGYTLEEDTKQNRSLWWNQRRKLDQWLSDLLSDVESLWFGPWKHLLLGELSNQKQLDSVQKKLLKDLRSKCKLNVHEDIIKVVIGGGVHASQREECLGKIFLKKGCYIGGRGCESPGEYSNSLSSVASELISNAVREIGDEDLDREPVILVPDFDIQMLPWESLPILRNQEVYRMPSVASISCTYHRSCHFQDKINKDPAVYPMIDPLDAYYLLNPGGDLCSTEAEFGNWFKDQNLEGTTGTSPSVDELSMALKNHDLFIYLGHGSGIQYISGGEIQKLDRCAATLLMGCSSGSLSLNGPYTPKGAPLYYLFAGSPVIIANLWDVTDKDIDRFGKTMLDSWIKVRSTNSVDCEKCTEISDKLEELNIDGGKRKAKRKPSTSTSVEISVVNNTSVSGCKHRPKIGSFMGQARGACTLPFLIGAAPVCYGVPTGIKKKTL
ncbi:separase [Rutidosis leptorrhynchoides]|uniref:separase n=1 Tax=Rutidosis leptorrhynchoides TaxID=125765 RepID=UPI003A9A3A55